MLYFNGQGDETALVLSNGNWFFWFYKIATYTVEDDLLLPLALVFIWLTWTQVFRTRFIIWFDFSRSQLEWSSNNLIDNLYWLNARIGSSSSDATPFCSSNFVICLGVHHTHAHPPQTCTHTHHTHTRRAPPHTCTPPHTYTQTACTHTHTHCTHPYTHTRHTHTVCLHMCACVYMHLCVCVCACVCLCMRACVLCVCVCACSACEHVPAF